MIYTSYFAKLNKLPENVVPISICAKAPAFYKGIQFKPFAPTYDMLMRWKQTQNIEYYIQHFMPEVLNKLKANEVVACLYQLSNGKDVALICYEKPTDFCHRHIISAWLQRNGFKCEEYRF